MMAERAAELARRGRRSATLPGRSARGSTCAALALLLAREISPPKVRRMERGKQ
jgi:hypothetical protein